MEQKSGLRMTETTNKQLPARLEESKGAYFTLQVCFHAEFLHKAVTVIILHCKHHPAANIVKFSNSSIYYLALRFPAVVYLFTAWPLMIPVNNASFLRNTEYVYSVIQCCSSL